jgi:outer membrane cobalamin receptor
MALSRLTSGPVTRCLSVFVLLLASFVGRAHAAPLSGRVVDPDGRPVARARVLVDGPIGVRVVTTDAEGRFALIDLPDATYRVSADADGLAAPARAVRVDREVADIELRLALTPYAEAVVVSAAPVPRAQSESPAAATVVSADQIEARQWTTTADALRLVPGFAVGQNGGRGALASIFPRGGESDYTLVLVDGIRLNTFGGGFNMSLLPFGDVEQLEIVRGPQSAVFGADAIGGVVQLTTKHGGEPSLAASIEGGGEATLRALGAARGSAGQWAFGASGERNQSDGYTGIAPATGETVSNDDWEQTVGSAHAEWSCSAATAVRADFRYLDAERGNPGPYGSNPIGAYEQVDRVSRGEDTQQQLGLDGRFPWGSMLRGRIQQRWQLTVADLDNRHHSPFGDSFFETRRVSARTQTDVVLSSTTGLTAGVEGFGERARSTYVTGASFQEVPIERRTIGAFAELRQDLGSRASLTGGVRLDDIRRDALEGDPNPFGPRPAFPAESVTSVNPRLAARFVAWQDVAGVARTTVRASAGTGIRPPDAFEIAFTDNPSLEPERSRSVDFGVSHVLFGPAVTERYGSLTVGATGFFNYYDDLIVAVGSSFQDASRYRTDNISNARARGVELEGAWRGPAGITTRVAYTWLDTEILAIDDDESAPPPFEVGDPLLRRPRHQGSADLGWARGPWSVFGTFRVRSSVVDVEPSFGTFGGLFTAPGFAVLDAGGSWTFSRQLTVFGRALNLLDREYEEAYGYPSPGRMGMIGVRVDFRP